MDFNHNLPMKTRFDRCRIKGPLYLLQLDLVFNLRYQTHRSDLGSGNRSPDQIVQSVRPSNRIPGLRAGNPFNVIILISVMTAS